MPNPFSSLSRGISNLLSRAVVRDSTRSTKCQSLSIAMNDDETKSEIEHLEPYGFTAAPLAGAEAVAGYFDGDKSHGVVLVVSDRRYRITGLESGEVCIYTDEGDNITLKRGKITEINTAQLIVNATDRVTMNTPLLEVPDGEISDKISTMSRMREQHNAHTHTDSMGGTTTTPNVSMGE